MSSVKGSAWGGIDENGHSTGSNVEEETINKELSSADGVSLEENVGGVGVVEKRFDYSTPYRDKFFAYLFLIHLVCMIIIAAWYGLQVKSYNNNNNNNNNNNQSSSDGGTSAFAIMSVAAIIGGVWSRLWLALFVRFSSKMIMITLGMNIFVLGAAAIISFSVGGVGSGVVYLSIIAVTCYSLYRFRRYIPFTTTILYASVQSLSKYSGPFYFIYVIAAVAVGWFLLWSYGASSLSTYVQIEYGGQPTSAQNFYMLFLVLSLYWTGQVIKNIGHTTTAGVVATFYFQPQTSSPTFPAFKRSITTSFGSICFGSLLVAIIRSIRELFNSSSNICGCIFRCCLAVVDRIMTYFNIYAYSMIAIYGYSFMGAASQTSGLIKARAIDALITNNVTSTLLFMGSLSAGAAAAIIGCLWGFINNSGAYAELVAFVGFIIAYIISLLFMSVVESAVVTTLVCYAMDPALFQQNHPEIYEKLQLAESEAKKCDQPQFDNNNPPAAADAAV